MTMEPHANRIRGHPYPEGMGLPDLQAPPLKPPHPSPPPPSVWRELGKLGVKVAAIAGVALLLFTFVYGLHYNTEPGMTPSIKDGDLAVYYRLDKKYHAGDLLLLVFQGEKQVRRVIATAGDTVDITVNGLTINGALQQERDIYRPTERYEDGIEFPLTLGEGEVFLLGDARDSVADSRVYGPVKTRDTLGTVIATLRRRNL
ncbi:MAG: signal peptidase I [Oscillospiraceae bacterium]|nr:signal peptidase I [Oscillospiraceae bacterium]